MAENARWETAPERGLAVTRTMYLRLPPDARLWNRGEQHVEAEPEKPRATME